jgi:SAM-dependent methyltransferase
MLSIMDASTGQRTERFKSGRPFFLQSKPPVADKDEKRKVLSFLVKEMLQQAESNPGSCDGECREIFRFKVKLDGKLSALQWECLYEDNLDVWGNIKTYLSGGVLRCGSQEFRVSQQGAESINRLIYKDHELDENSYCLTQFLNGNRFEWIRTAKQKVLAPNYFDNWEREKKIYREEVYPSCLQCLQLLLPDKASILELCAGDGEFASLLYNQMGGKIDSYVLIDSNKKAIDFAKELFREQIVQSKVRVIEGNVVTTDYEKVFEENQVDLILGIGALTEQVISSREEAVTAFKNAAAMLKEGGYIVLTGLTSSWLVSSDFQDNGFEVLNCFKPSSDSRKKEASSPEFYIARKVKGGENPKPLWDFPPPKVGSFVPRLSVFRWTGH